MTPWQPVSARESSRSTSQFHCGRWPCLERTFWSSSTITPGRRRSKSQRRSPSIRGSGRSPKSRSHKASLKSPSTPVSWTTTKRIHRGGALTARLRLRCETPLPDFAEVLLSRPFEEEMIYRAAACVVIGIVLAAPFSSSSHTVLDPELVDRLMVEIAQASDESRKESDADGEALYRLGEKVE